jgi:hypothetical protein
MDRPTPTGWKQSGAYGTSIIANPSNHFEKLELV